MAPIGIVLSARASVFETAATDGGHRAAEPRRVNVRGILGKIGGGTTKGFLVGITGT